MKRGRARRFSVRRAGRGGRRITIHEIFAWLKENLGPNSLGPLTGTDYRALTAAVTTLELYAYHTEPALLEAFAAIVRSGLQPKNHELAYHMIAHVLDWHDRQRLWHLAGLPPLYKVSRCKHEPRSHA